MDTTSTNHGIVAMSDFFVNFAVVVIITHYQ